jgi:hypothetical protein
VAVPAARLSVMDTGFNQPPQGAAARDHWHPAGRAGASGAADHREGEESGPRNGRSRWCSIERDGVRSCSRRLGGNRVHFLTYRKAAKGKRLPRLAEQLFTPRTIEVNGAK